MKSLLSILVWLVLSPATAMTVSCPPPALDSAFNVTLPCVGVEGVPYAVNLLYTTDADGLALWRLNGATASTCSWNADTCATAGQDLSLTIPAVRLGEIDNTVLLSPYSAAAPLSWQYRGHSPTQTAYGSSDSHGTFSPFTPPAPRDGRGRKLLAVYMVGSNLENSRSQAGTQDLLELIDGYRRLSAPSVDVIVAFGGAKKDGWRGMKFADMAQLREDANDGRFGNSTNYLYRADYAHMGDAGSFRHFLNYLRAAYVNYDRRFLVLWDHGASYKGFGNDQVYNMDALALPEIRQALSDSGRHFDLLGFDACLMGSLETAKYIHEYADYLLASEDIEPGHGWNWSALVAAYAANSDPVETAKAIIDNYVDEASHPYRSSGKTLSLADLSRFGQAEAGLAPVLDKLRSGVTANDTPLTTATDSSLKNARGYSSSYWISLDMRDFLVYLENLSADPALKQAIDSALSALDAYLIYSRHDGSRPNSYGASLDRLDNEPYPVSLNPSVSALQAAWQGLRTSDQSPPQLGDRFDKVELVGINSVTAQELLLLRNYIDSGNLPAPQLPWWEKAYQIMAGRVQSLSDKLVAAAALENESRGVFKADIVRNYFLGKGVEIVRGVEVAPALTGVELVRSGKAADRLLSPATGGPRTATDSIARPMPLDEFQPIRPSGTPLVTQERAVFTVPDNSGLQPRSATADPLLGSVAGFSDDNPIRVTAVYGTIYDDPLTGEAQDFDTFAELEAFPTQYPGIYFTYTWNRMWYTVKYNSDLSSIWLPLRFDRRFWQNDMLYTVYLGEIYYRDAQALYPEPSGPADAEAVCAADGLVARDGRCFQQAILELHADEANLVTAHYVRPYQIIENHVQFDKDSAFLKNGDLVWFFFDSFGLEPGAGAVRLPNTFSGPVVFTQDPVFAVEMMAAVSGMTLLPKKFYYALKATDIAGKSTISPPVPAKTPMPVCANLSETQDGLAQVVSELAVSPKIEFVSPLGDTLDRAMSTLMVTAEAEEAPAFLSEVEALYRLLYNIDTVDFQTTDWVWGDRVAWPQVKIGIEALLPAFQAIVQRECN